MIHERGLKMTVSVVIPVSDQHEITDECIDLLVDTSSEFIDIVIVDNASETPYENDMCRVIRNDHNAGFWPSMLQGIDAAQNNIVVCMHNDVFMWDHGWNERVESEFALDSKLGMVGLFGGRGVSLDGGRGYPESNMVARKYGTHGNLHGALLTGKHPAVVFDSLMMTFRRDYLYTIDYETIPIHHWTDRLVTLRMIKAGYHALTLGIAFDHGGGFTSTRKGMQNDSMQRWCEERNIPFETSWDLTVYHYGRMLFEKELQELLGPGYTQLWANQDYRYGIR